MQKVRKYFIIIWVSLTLVVFSSVLISPLTLGYGSLIAFLIPLFVVTNIVLIVLSLITKSKQVWVYIILTALAWPFFSVSFQLNVSDDNNSNEIKVLSYNVKWFIDARKDNYKEALDWLISEEADVICMQEFYPRRNISSRIITDGGYFNATYDARYNVAIYSKYPIVNKGLLFPDSELNNVLFADLKIDSDTLRIYSVHLQSMGINPDKIQDSEGIRTEYEDIKLRMLAGSKERAKQMEKVLNHADNSPFPLIIAGDFNDVPFSYNYFKVRGIYKNAFEEKGSGLGVTYNGKIPFLRIDNQFFSNGLEIEDFETLNKVNYSDHFPIVGKYRISP